MKILVTGGAGFIGSCFIRYILNKYSDYKITNLDLLTYCANLKNLKDVENNPNYTFIKGDICDENLVNKIASNIDIIVNFAAESHVDNAIKTPDIFLKTNTQGTLNLLNCAKNNKIKKFIQISTDEVYGSIEKGYFKEDSPLSPSNPYAASKAAADLVALSYFKTYNLPVIITRCSNNFGEHQYPEKLIPYFILKLLKDEQVTLYGDGQNIRDWIYVYDHASAIDKIIHEGKIGEIYNISAHNEKTNLEITKIILDTLGKDDKYISYIKNRLAHDKRYAISTDKINSQLNWYPSFEFKEAIIKTIKWYIENQNLYE